MKITLSKCSSASLLDLGENGGSYFAALQMRFFDSLYYVQISVYCIRDMYIVRFLEAEFLESGLWNFYCKIYYYCCVLSFEPCRLVHPNFEDPLVIRSDKYRVVLFSAFVYVQVHFMQCTSLFPFFRAQAHSLPYSIAQHIYAWMTSDERWLLTRQQPKTYNLDWV